jgi:5-methylcytosine-specific restriction endonuclease McrA
VAALLAAGQSRAEVARRLGISKGTVSYHARRLGEAVDSRCARRYDWIEIQGYYDTGHSVRDCQARFGFSRCTWNEAVKRGAVVARPSAMPMDDLLIAGIYRSRHNLKLRMLSTGLKEDRCECCGLSSWRELPISLALHHVNGDRLDNRLENLQLLCPNCHSQTENFAGRASHGGRFSKVGRR